MNDQLYQICNYYCRFPAMIANEEELEKICRECPLTEFPERASEGSCYLKAKEDASIRDLELLHTADKILFVSNVGWLLSQTREGIKKIELDGNDAVIVFRNGFQKKVDIECCSYAAIVKTLAKAIV